MFQLHFGNQVFSQPSDFERKSADLSGFAQAAFSFCKEWLSGQTHFSQQTSGSTGVPKKIEMLRRQMIASAEATRDFFQIQPNTTLLCCLSPEYIAGKMMLVRAMVWDCPIWLVEPSSLPLARLDFIPDFVAMVPLQAEQSLHDSQSKSKLKQIKHLLIGGAPISERLRRNLLDHKIRAWQTYGMTESVSHIALARIEDSPAVYHTLPGVHIGQDARGALWVQSPMSGPEKIQTNDLVEMISEHHFSWLGRADFVVNSGGVKLHPELLEQKAEKAIQDLFQSSRFFFFGEKDTMLGERLVLIIEHAPDPQAAQKLIQKLGTVLGKYEVPKAVYFIPTFVQTPNGKVNRHETYQNL
jgi:O-succinylbenzoic acid--CoA ligase